ncbi:unnamed protein product [Ostreobium quekettii]|uniref:Protein kinase domain-containing protein n=1 Tax=Ostreobium quekettii TaxID=121088 RepID=A0A8S1J362_9CHLO|nr:unnamed protein product [Ostreobium quekettii]
MPARRRALLALLICAVAAAEVVGERGPSSGDVAGDAGPGRGLAQAPESVAQRVSTCRELQEALKRESVMRILIEDNIVCTRQNWPEPIIVRRNLDVTQGLAAADGGGGPDGTEPPRASVNWTNVQHVLIVERAAVVYFHDLLMFQDDMGLAGALDLLFIDTRKGATGVFSGLVVVVRSCGVDVDDFEDLVAGWPRPEFLTGRQRARAIGPSTVLVGDVALWFPEVNSLWQVCNAVIECGVPEDFDARIAEHFDSPWVSSSCANVDGGSDALPLPLSEAAQRGVGGPGSGASIVGTIVLVVTVTGLVVAMTAGMTYYHVRRIKKHVSAGAARENMKSQAAMAMKKEAEGGAGGPSFAIELFAKNMNVPLQDVEVGTLLGRGGFGKVYKGTWKGTTVAIKVIEHGERLMENELKLPFEAYLSKHISHPNVVQTFLIHTRQQDSPHGVTVDTMDLNDSLNQMGDKNSLMSTHDIFSNMAKGSVGNEGGELFETWLVLEYCDRGSLAKAVRKGLLSNHKTGKPRMDHVLLSALDVANAMNYLHSLGITHGDLKADNVLLKSANTDRRGFFCKVSDFGLSRFMGKNDYIQTFTYGTITHMPPELLKDGILTPSVDVYSFGMLLWELLADLQPYSEKNHGEIILAVVNEGRRPLIDDSFPDCYADLIRDCWKQNRQDRPRFPDIVRRLKQMNVNLVTYGTPNGAAVTDSAGSLSLIRRIGEPSLIGPQCTESLQRKFDAGVLPESTTTLPEVRSNNPYYETTNSGETKGACPVLRQDSAGFIADYSHEIDSESDSHSHCSGSSDGYRSAASQVTRSSEHSSSSFHFQPT